MTVRLICRHRPFSLGLKFAETVPHANFAVVEFTYFTHLLSTDLFSLNSQRGKY